MAQLDASYDDSRAEEALAQADSLWSGCEYRGVREPISLEEAISLINIRKQNLGNIFGIDLEAQIANGTREHELDCVLEILRRVRS